MNKLLMCILGQATTEQWVESAKSTAGKAHDKACEAAGKSQEQAQRSKEENAGFLQQVLNFSQTENKN